MSHELEIKADGKASMAWAGEIPWHGLGKEVPSDLTPTQMLKAAQLDWEVEKVPTYADIDGKKVMTGDSALVRSTDKKIIDIVSNDWNTIQNAEAFQFFHEFVMAGEMEMNTAGSLKDGQVVWGLAKVKDGFELFKGDRVESYLLFTNFHRFGFATDVRFSPIRVVCNNTLTVALNGKVERMVKISHRTKFNASDVKLMLGIAHEKLEEYKSRAEFLGNRFPKEDQVSEFFRKVFPLTTDSNSAKFSKNATAGMAMFESGSHPGSKYAEHSFWQLFNTVTFMADHQLGKTQDNRLYNSWYGYVKDLKVNALNQAVKIAEKV